VQVEAVAVLVPAARIPWDFRSPDLAVVRRAISACLKPFSLEAAADGPYDARICHRKLIGTELTLINYGAAVSIDAGCMDSFYVVQIPLSGAYWFYADGQRTLIGRGQAHVVHPAVHLRMQLSAACQLLVLRTADSRLRDADTRLPRDTVTSSHGRILSCSEGAGASLGRAVDFLTSELMQSAFVASGTPAASAAEALLIGALLHAMSTPLCSAGRGRPEYLIRAEQHIMRNLDAELAVADIVKASRASARSLFRAFRDAHGASPRLWIRTQRLARVRSELINLAQGHRSVSAIALRWGFTHFGHFCAAYRNLYGETATETRARVDRSVPL
jgi:AraC-like DNA-binding protein